MRHGWMIAAIAGLMLGITGTAQAQQLSHYLPGLPNSNDLFLPPEEAGELVYLQYNVYYRPAALRNGDGKEIDEITFTPRFGNPRTVDLDLDIDLVYIVPTMVWAPDVPVLGGRYAAYVALPVGHPSINAGVESALGFGRNIDESSWGVGDMFIQPLWFMWTFPRQGRRPTLDVTAGYGFDAPTGRYEAGAADNTGLGFWEHQFQSALRLRVDERIGLNAFVAHTFEVGHNKEDADIRPGAHYTTNWGFGRQFAEGWLETAVLGYHSFQITEDSGSDVLARTKDDLDQVHGIGAQLGVPKLGLSVKYFREFCAQSRFEGDLVTFTFALPLELLAQKVGLDL